MGVIRYLKPDFPGNNQEPTALQPFDPGRNITPGFFQLLISRFVVGFEGSDKSPELSGVVEVNRMTEFMD